MVQKQVINLIKSAKKSFFISEKMKKYRKCPALPFFNVFVNLLFLSVVTSSCAEI